MADLIQLIFSVGIPLVLLAIGLFAGRVAERKHFASLALRETQQVKIFTTDLSRYPLISSAQPTPQIVITEVVIATDYFKSFVASLKKLVGGSLGTYLSLVERARREAILRLKEQASQMGYNAICNVRLETADIGGTSEGKGKVAMVAVLASATAYRVNEDATRSV